MRLVSSWLSGWPLKCAPATAKRIGPVSEMGAAGAGSLSQVVNAALANQDRFNSMNTFFEGVGKDHATGVWESVPVDRPEFKADVRRRLEKAIAKQKAEEIG